ncbi:MAG: hypothetical protein ACK4VZ_02160 [Paracoccaceae bacterium]
MPANHSFAILSAAFGTCQPDGTFLRQKHLKGQPMKGALAWLIGIPIPIIIILYLIDVF